MKKQSSFEKSLEGKQDWPPKRVKNPVLTLEMVNKAFEDVLKPENQEITQLMCEGVKQ